jgi:predicted aminopeptidase
VTSWLRLLVAACVAVCASGCGTFDVDAGWLFRQGVGQLEVLSAARPVDPIIDDPTVSRDVRRRLAIAVAARNFARDRLGLAVDDQYRTAVFLDAPAIVYVVSAAAPDSLTPRTWRYPVVGGLPYRGHFSLEDAEAEADALEATGLDVSVRPVSTYSLLGIAPDPILSSMLFRREELDLVETVIHELAHATVFAPGQGAFNEGLATFIGREGRKQFVRERFGPNSAVAARANAVDDDDDAWSRAVGALAFDLRILFAQANSRTRSQVLDEKQRIFARHQRHWQQEVAPTLFSVRLRGARLPENNAELAAVGIYSLKQHLYAGTVASCGGDWRCFLRALAGVAGQADPEVALAEWSGPSSREVRLP